MADDTICRRARTCRLLFKQVIAQISSRPFPDEQSPPGDDIRIDYEDQVARFNMWAASIGVFADAHASLDYRLRASQDVALMIVDLLEGLKRKLQRGWQLPPISSGTKPYSDNLHLRLAFQVCSNENLPLGQTSTSELPLPDTASTAEESSISSSCSSLSSSFETQRDSSLLARSLREVTDTINLLHRISIIIRESSSHRRRIKADNYVLRNDSSEDSEARKFFEHVVTGRHRTAGRPPRPPVALSNTTSPDDPVDTPTWLHLRLATTMLQRKDRLTYQRLHKQDLARDTTIEDPASDQHLSSQQMSGLALNPSNPGNQVSRGLSFTRGTGLLQGKRHYAQTATTFDQKNFRFNPKATPTASVTSRSNIQSKRAELPPAPKVSEKMTEIPCEYCGLTLKVKSGKVKGWTYDALHILMHEPYLCCFSD